MLSGFPEVNQGIGWDLFTSRGCRRGSLSLFSSDGHQNWRPLTQPHTRCTFPCLLAEERKQYRWTPFCFRNKTSHQSFLTVLQLTQATWALLKCCGDSYTRFPCHGYLLIVISFHPFATTPTLPCHEFIRERSNPPLITLLSSASPEPTTSSRSTYHNFVLFHEVYGTFCESFFIFGSDFRSFFLWLSGYRDHQG